MTVLVLIEADDELSLQAVTLARSLAGGGSELHGLGVESSRAPVDVLHVAELAGSYAPAAWAAATVQLVQRVAPSHVVAPGSDRGNEVLAHVAARLDLPMAANVTDVRGDELTRQRWGGTLLEEARLHADLKLLSAAPFAFAAALGDESTQSRIETFAPELTAADTAVRVVERISASTGGVSLADAKVVVSGGRGVGSREGFAILEELAALLDAAVGCSRVVTSAGWRPHADQVGQTGTKVSPELYIACGISGATQHIAGCKGAKKLLAINADAEATIFAHADYAVIGDLHEIVPAITAELRKVRAQ
jgi:electron transfer flavoprotein alpha subunit